MISLRYTTTIVAFDRAVGEMHRDYNAANAAATGKLTVGLFRALVTLYTITRGNLGYFTVPHLNEAIGLDRMHRTAYNYCRQMVANGMVASVNYIPPKREYLGPFAPNSFYLTDAGVQIAEDTVKRAEIHTTELFLLV